MYSDPPPASPSSKARVATMAVVATHGGASMAPSASSHVLLAPVLPSTLLHLNVEIEFYPSLSCQPADLSFTLRVV